MDHHQKPPAAYLMRALLQQQQRRQHLGAACWKLRQHLGTARWKETYSSQNRIQAHIYHQQMLTEHVMGMVPAAITTAAVMAAL
jgi:hypothetical protein